MQLGRSHQGIFSAVVRVEWGKSLVQAIEQRDNCHSWFPLVFYSFGEAILLYYSMSYNQQQNQLSWLVGVNTLKGEINSKY